MSEKSLFNWLNTKMGAEWESERIENCSNKGIPDTVIRINGITTFMELKDWSGKDKHPLTIEQRNFLVAFGGCVAIRDKNKDVIICNSEYLDLSPLLTGDLNWAIKNGITIKRQDFSPIRLYNAIILGKS